MSHPELDPFVARSLRAPFGQYLLDDRRTAADRRARALRRSGKGEK
ncbi:hypothetical protein [Georgenia deserti]|uniref:Uncharacterized protein n=1 Tax=Georgenia deserti TaxID=2093781 RepID=A0ABW4LA82_9MICO